MQKKGYISQTVRKETEKKPTKKKNTQEAGNASPKNQGSTLPDLLKLLTTEKIK